MKKIICFILALLLVISLLGCGRKKSVSEEFLSNSILPEFFSAFYDNASKAIIYPETAKTADFDLVYTFYEDGEPYYEYKSANVLLNKENKKAVIKTAGLNIEKENEIIKFNGNELYNVFESGKLSDFIRKFLNALTNGTDEKNYKSMLDSIKTSEKDEEVTAVTLTLSEDETTKALSGVKELLNSDDEVKTEIKRLISYYSYLHNAKFEIDGVYNSLVSYIDRFSDKELKYTRYVKDGVTSACRIQLGDFSFYYIVSSTKNGKELDMSAELNSNKLFTLSYGIVNGYNYTSYTLRLDINGKTTMFDGKTNSAYKSGMFEFDVRASDNTATVKGVYFKAEFDNSKTYLSCKGEGSVTENDVKTPYSYSFMMK